MQPQRDIPLAPLTTFRLGGKARYFVAVKSDDEVAEAMAWADEAHVSEVFILGGGSNLVVADSGLPGLVLHVGIKGISIDDRGSSATIWAGAGESWDDLVRFAVDRELVGLECLSGIPGSVGATPVQNVGAYGQEIAQALACVVVFDRKTRTRRTLHQSECEFGYRDSVFKNKEPDRYIVLRVEFQLARRAPDPVRHREIQAYLQEQDLPTPNGRQIRQAILALRAKKSLLFHPDDPLSRNAGSFFLNPIVTNEVAQRIQATLPNESMPLWETSDGRKKLAAAWLIEQSGLPRGYQFGSVGLSPHHCLVIVAHARAEAADVVAFANQVRTSVKDKFGVTLIPEPHFWGFSHFESGLPLLNDSGPDTLGSAPWRVSAAEQT